MTISMKLPDIVTVGRVYVHLLSIATEATQVVDPARGGFMLSGLCSSSSAWIIALVARSSLSALRCRAAFQSLADVEFRCFSHGKVLFW